MRLRGKRGVTLLELLISITIALIVLYSISKAFIAFVQGNARHQKTAQLQQEISSVAQMLEQDGRMVGFGLPGNGLDVNQASSASDSVIFFINEHQLQTTLSADADAEAVSLHVASTAGVSAHQWVCLDKTGTRVYREISSVAPGNEIFLTTTSGAVGFGMAETKVYFANRFMYFVNDSVSPPQLTRMINNTPRIVSSMVTNLAVAAKDATGTVLAANYDQARSVAVTVTGGGTGRRDAQVRTETVEVVIRNYQ